MNKDTTLKLKTTLPSALLLATLSLSAFGQDTPAWTGIVERASKSVVLLKGVTNGGTVLGSGFVLSADGKIATNLHVIRDMKSGGVQLASGEVFDSFTVLAFDDRKDLAIIKVPGFDLPTIELGNSNDLKAGEAVMAIGSPEGLKGSVTAGVVSAIRDDPFSGGYKVIQTDAAANPGNSGGPLLNDKGQAVGVITSKLKATEGLNFAVPINYVRGLMSSTEQPIGLVQLSARLSAAPADAFKSGEAFPTSWKSMSSGNRFKIRNEGDVLYVEGVLSDAAKRDGDFYAWELRKFDDRYTGKEHSVIAVYNHFPNGNVQFDHKCAFEFPAEFSLLTASRIEGRLKYPPLGAKLNYKKCSYDKPYEWSPFVWIPE
jgi:S1-C subfamily serine protease